jgi:hypothetical protein
MQNELGWHIIVYNLRRKIKIQENKVHTFLFFEISICPFGTRLVVIQTFKNNLLLSKAR